MSQEILLLDRLNNRELEIIPLLAAGLTNAEIANQLFLAPNTVKWYVGKLNSKLNTRNRVEIVARVHKLGLIERGTSGKSYIPPLRNLPYQTTPFVGRDAELDELRTILENPNIRLLTILASGGMGKTRIALEAAEQQINNFADGVYFVPLQALSEIEQIIPAIASSCFFSFQADQPIRKQQLLDFLANKQMLLLIDNWEHLLDYANLLNDILTAAPKVKILATSREKLNLLGETTFVLEGMKFPAWEIQEDALSYDAVQLLMLAAQRVKPDWKVSQDNLDYVARICHLTQGMPLGILLAASWLDVYSLERICDEIQKNVDILETEMRDVPERQRSIRAVFDYSWERLQHTEQDVLMRISVFRGGCTPQAVEKITGANPRIFQSLINKALLTKNKNGRYDIHELLRQYAEKRLYQSSTADDTLDAHMHYYAQALRELESHLEDHRMIEAIQTIEGDFENIRIAWLRAIELADEQVLNAMCECLHEFVTVQVSSEALALLEKSALLEGRISRAIWGRLLTRRMKPSMGGDGNYQKLLEQALDIAREHNDEKEIVINLLILGNTLGWQGQADVAIKMLEEALALSEIRGNIYFQAWSRHYLATCYGNNFYLLEETQHLYKDAYTLFKQVQHPFGMGSTLMELSYFTLLEATSNAMAKGQKYLEEALIHTRKVGAAQQLVNVLGELGEVEGYFGRFDKAESYETESYQIAFASGNRLIIQKALFSRARTLVQQERYQEALAITDEMYTRLTERTDATEFYMANLMRGTALCGLARYKEAILLIDHHLIHHFKQDAPLTRARILAFKGLIMAHQEQQERALELFALLSTLPEFRYYRDWHPLILRLETVLKTSFDEDTYQKIWARGLAQAENWREVVQTLLDEIKL